MKSNNTVIESIIEEIRNGMLLRKPIVYLKTANLEIIRRVLNSDQIVVRMANKGADTTIPFAAISKSTWHSALVDGRIQNIKCYSLSDLAVNSSLILGASSDDNEIYGRFKFANLNKTDKSVTYLQPSILALSVHKPMRETENMNSSYFDKLLPFIDRYTQEADDSNAIRSSLVLLYGDEVEIPSWISPYCYIVEEPYPERTEIEEIIQRKIDAFKTVKIPKETIKTYATSFLGNTLLEVENTVEYLLNLPDNSLTHRPIIEDSVIVQEILAKLKEQNVKRFGLLELMKIDYEEKLGGMERFKKWLDVSKESILESDRLYRETGADRQKGILMCGIPGCGKSAAVNILATELNLPVLKMDIGRLMGSFVGDSEHNIHKALRLAEAMSPCILYIDEIEKGFSGNNGTDSSGVAKRMFGILLTWMQECKKPVYIFATANSLSGLPKEFFRSGRFDSLFALYMPTFKECIDIFQKRMEKAEAIVKKQSSEKAALFMKECYDAENLGIVMNYLVDKRDSVVQHRFVTGADITKLVNIALRQFSKRNGAINHVDWIQALKNAIDGTIVYGAGEENLVSIAACYVQMMRLGFTPTSHTDDTLFEPGAYHVEYAEQKTQPTLDIKEGIKVEYDSTLYNIIREKILLLATRLEENVVHKLID